MDISDYGRNQDLLMGFKKSCGDTIKFASKNIPFALIQVIIFTKEISSMVLEMGKFFLGCYDYRLFLRVSVADGPSIN